jgi:uncharacterized protein YcfJ
MSNTLRIALAAAGIALAVPAAAQVTFYEHENFGGRSFTTRDATENLQGSGFNDRASSVVVHGNGRWEVCANANREGRCVVLRPGPYPTLGAMGLNDRISSVRALRSRDRIDDARYAPVAPDYRRRRGERLFEAEVTSVHAVLGERDQRCWIEREQVAAQQRSHSNVPGALAGAVIGAVLGHQVGGGSGRDLATVGGAVAGGYVGSRTGRSGEAGPAPYRDVQRCNQVSAAARPDHWDVTYDFRGQEHHVQLMTPPGRTVTVNRQGEPRQ